MYNAYGWIQLGTNRQGIDPFDEKLEEEYDQYDQELEKMVKERLEEILVTNELIRFDFISAFNNLDNFLSIQLSRNHFSPTLRDLYQWVSEVSDGSHGILYEMDMENESFNPNKPYKVWRLIGNDFEECEEKILNEHFHKVNY